MNPDKTLTALCRLLDERDAVNKQRGALTERGEHGSEEISLLHRSDDLSHRIAEHAGNLVVHLGKGGRLPMQWVPMPPGFRRTLANVPESIWCSTCERTDLAPAVGASHDGKTRLFQHGVCGTTFAREAE